MVILVCLPSASLGLGRSKNTNFFLSNDGFSNVDLAGLFYIYTVLFIYITVYFMDFYMAHSDFVTIELLKSIFAHSVI